MKLSECWERYTTYTKDVTDQSRKLGLVLGAACWFFRTPEASFPPWVLRSLLALVAFFFFDLVQLLLGALLLRWWTRREEKRMWEMKNAIDGDAEKPWWLDRPAFICFMMKEAALLASFAFLSGEFMKRL